jgi:phosphopantothenoylcysteine decarboxylase/phosphopantothenate--cysteine ligase
VLAGKRIIVGVTGSIAAYKAAFFVRELVKAGAEVRVVMTHAACEFITPLTMATVSGSDVVLDMFPQDRSKGTWHIHLGLWADVMIVAPASANTIARLAHGFADNALTSLALAIRCPLLVAPAMDTDMYVHEATQSNIRVLRERGVTIIEPESGELASGLTGPGRLPEPRVLISALEQLLGSARDLEGRSVLVTAGPTHEAIDPVRFIGNHSSGRMGFAIAEAAAVRGADVMLVSGPVSLPTPPGVQRVDVTSAAEIHASVTARAEGRDIVVMAAAVADYTPAQPSERKIKKDNGGDALDLRLRRTADILAELGATHTAGVLVGFALETDNAEEYARRKLESKGADLIVMNNPREPGAAFGTETNLVTIFSTDGGSETLPLLPKSSVAHIILDRAARILQERS